MLRRWVNKNIDLEILSGHICDFFKMLDFEIAKCKTDDGYVIFADNSPCCQLNGFVSVTVKGDSQDFSIDVRLNRNKKMPNFPSPLILGMFGAGFILRNWFRSEDLWMKLEREFWIYLQNVILQLTTSC